jgi:hypothetical protein
MMCQNLKQVVIDAIGAHVAETEGDNTGQIGPGSRHELAEIKIMRHEDAALHTRKIQYGRIGKAK